MVRCFTYRTEDGSSIMAIRVGKIEFRRISQVRPGFSGVPSTEDIYMANPLARRGFAAFHPKVSPGSKV